MVLLPPVVGCLPEKASKGGSGYLGTPSGNTLEPGPLDPKMSALTMRPLHLAQFLLISVVYYDLFHRLACRSLFCYEKYCYKKELVLTNNLM